MNGPTARLRIWGTPPDRYADRKAAASTIDAAGRIIALLVATDVSCSERGAAPHPYAATVVVMDGDDITEVDLSDLDLRFPKIDILGDGFILAATRCRMPSGPAAATVAELEAQIPHNALRVQMLNTSDEDRTAAWQSLRGVEAYAIELWPELAA